MKTEKDKQLQKEMIDEVVGLIQQKGEELRVSGKSPYDQLPQMDVLLDTIRFLDRYDENVKVLNQYYLGKPRWEREK